MYNLSKKNNIKALFPFCLFLLVSISAMAQGFGEQQLLKENWHFHLGDLKYGGIETLDDSKWETVTVPHDWSVEQNASPALASCTGYLPGGVAWYRRNIEVPASRKGEKVYIYFGGVYNNSEVFINGKWVGRRPNGYISFMYDLTPYINFGGRNVIAVKVDHSKYADSRWYTGSGIYRDVKLIFANTVHIGLWGVSYQTSFDNDNAKLNAYTEIKNQSHKQAKVKIQQILLDREGKEIAQYQSSHKVDVNVSQKVYQQIKLKNIRRWSLTDPYLYTMITKVYNGNKLIDQTSTRVGFRSIKYDSNNGFALNDVWTKLKGVCIHHDAGALGAAVPAEVWITRMQKLKSIGVNAIRMSHNPQSQAVYDACDSLGLVIMDEAFDEWEYSKKKWIDGWNVGTPGYDGSAFYFREWCDRDMADMVRRDRNHPSIIMWSIGNEIDYPNDPYSHAILDKEKGTTQSYKGGYLKDHPNANRLGEIAKELVSVVKKYDTTRPTTAALAGAVMSNETTYPGSLDIVGYNYTEYRYDEDHAKYPNRVLYGSETGHGLNSWKVVRDKKFIFGQFIWTGYDYLGEAGVWPSRGLNTGLIEQDDNIKPNGYFSKSLWSEEPMIYVGALPSNTPHLKNKFYYMPHVWNYENNEKMTVVVYTNGDSAELYLNNIKVGDKKAYDDNTGLIMWTIPYNDGELKAISYIDGKKVAEDTIITTGMPYKLEAKIIGPKKANKFSMLQIPICIKDKDGNMVELSDANVTCHISGNAKLIGIENGSNDVRLNYRINHQRAHRGTLKAYVELTEPHGEVYIKITSPLLKQARLVYKY